MGRRAMLEPAVTSRTIAKVVVRRVKTPAVRVDTTTTQELPALKREELLARCRDTPYERDTDVTEIEDAELATVADPAADR